MSSAGVFSPVANALSVAILHGLWQGVLIGLVTAGTLAAVSSRSARARYGVACLALAVMLVAFAATFSVALADALKAYPVAARAGAVRLHPVSVDAMPPPLSWWPAVFGGQPRGIEDSALPFGGPWLAVTWLVGAAVVALSSILQFAAVRRLTAGAHFDVGDRWRDAFEAVSRDLRLDRLARLGHSAAVEVPTVVGWLAPIVLVPLAPCTALSHDELCAILAHELAHIRRRDYLVNAVQKVVEVVLFFHPVTWWLSRRIRVEREYCCDDVVVQYTSSALVYARALSQLETLRTQRRAFAMGADGGSLMNRIARIVGAKPERRRLSIVGGAIGALAVAIVGVAFIVGNPGVALAGGGSATPGPAAKTPGPGDANVAPAGIVAAADGALDRLVANGTINQSQANTIKQDVASGRVDPQKLVSAGVVTAAQAQTVADTLGQVKASFASTNGARPGGAVSSCDRIAAKLTQAVKDGKMTQEQANQQLAGCTTGGTTGATKTTGGRQTR